MALAGTGAGACAPVLLPPARARASTDLGDPFADAATDDAADLLEALTPAHAERAAAILSHVREAATRTGVAEDFILAVMFVESRFQPDATSPVGARGLMQLMPRTAAALAADLGIDEWDAYDPAFNTLAGATYLARLLERFEGDFRLALAAYNAGPTRVSRWRREGRTIPGSVRSYVSKVLLMRERLAAPEWIAALEERHDDVGLEAVLKSSPVVVPIAVEPGEAEPESVPAEPESVPATAESRPATEYEPLR